MKILFVIPPNKSMFGDKGMTAHPHIGIAYLNSFLKQNEVDVAIFDEGLDSDPKKLYSIIEEFNPDLIGLTIFSYCYRFAYNTIKNISLKVNLPIVIGGSHVSAVGREALEDNKIRFAVKQEGEFTLLELLRELQKENPEFNHIKGLIWRDHEGQVVENIDRPLLTDLDYLPFPDYVAFGIEHYPCYKQKLLPIITSRGCPYECNYCSVRLSMGRKFRMRSAGNVFNEIKCLYDQGWRNFDINDDCFTLDKERAERICDLIIGNKLDIRFQLYNGIRADTVNKELLKKMKMAGCYFISYGCESGSKKVLKVIKKGVTLEQVKNAVKWTNEIGISNSVNFIIGHKEETYQDALDTINFAKSLPADFVNFYNLLPYPGTESFEWARQNARFLVPPDSFLENISYRDNKPIFETEEFTKVEREKIISLGFDLYREKILKFRLGVILGSIAYWITKNKIIDKLATNFALTNPLGRFIYIKLSGKSFTVKQENTKLGAT